MSLADEKFGTVMEIFATMTDPWRDFINIFITQRSWGEGETRRSIALPVVFEEMKSPEIGAVLLPTFQLRKDYAQQLIDELWRCGLRPSEGSGSAGSLAATQKHLEDMRTLVFKPKSP